MEVHKYTGQDVIDAIEIAGLKDTILTQATITVKLEEHISYISYGVLDIGTGEIKRQFSQTRLTQEDYEQAVKDYYRKKYGLDSGQ